MPKLKSSVPSPMEVWRMIEEEMNRQGMTRYQLSQEAGVSQNQLSRMANGHGACRYETLAKLADAVNLAIIVKIEKG